MAEIDLQKFCFHGENQRFAHIKKTFAHGGFLYATNGHICIRVPTLLPDNEGCYPAAWDLFPANVPDSNMVMGPPIRFLDEAEKCRCCDGGTKAPDECTPVSEDVDDGECVKCHGVGRVITSSSMVFGTRNIAAQYVYLVYSLLNVKVRIGGGRSSPMYFRFEGGEGVVIGLN